MERLSVSFTAVTVAGQTVTPAKQDPPKGALFQNRNDGFLPLLRDYGQLDLA